MRKPRQRGKVILLSSQVKKLLRSKSWDLNVGSPAPEYILLTCVPTLDSLLPTWFYFTLLGLVLGWLWRGHPGWGRALPCPLSSLFGKESGLLSRCLQGLKALRQDSDLSLQWPWTNLEAQLMLCRWLTSCASLRCSIGYIGSNRTTEQWPILEAWQGAAEGLTLGTLWLEYWSHLWEE